MIKKIFKYSFFTLFFGLWAFISYYGLSKWLVVSEIQIEIQKDPTWEGSTDDIKSLLQKKLQKFIGKTMWQVSFEELIKAVRSEPRVGPVKILRILPNRFFIQIQSRRPLVILLNPANGKIHPLSMDGQVLPPLLIKEVPNLPILRGAVFFQQKALRKRVIRFLNLLPEKGEFSRKEISEIKYSDQEKSLIFILSRNGKPVKVGYDPLQMKTKRIESVLRYLEQKNIKWRVIDARFSQKIVVSTSKAI